MSTEEATIKGYLEEAASWDRDRIAQARRTTLLAVGVAATGWIAVIGLVLALALLMPLKQVEPFVVRVDSLRGDFHSQEFGPGQSFFLFAYAADFKSLSSLEFDRDFKL